jgi:hypothetical protein
MTIGRIFALNPNASLVLNLAESLRHFKRSSDFADLVANKKRARTVDRKHGTDG